MFSARWKTVGWLFWGWNRIIDHWEKAGRQEEPAAAAEGSDWTRPCRTGLLCMCDSQLFLLTEASSEDACSWYVISTVSPSVPLFGLQTVETPHQLSSPSSALPTFLSPQDAPWFGRIASAFYVFIAGGTQKLLLGYSYALGWQCYFALILFQGYERAYWSVENKCQLHKSILDSVHSSWLNNMIALDTVA